MVYCGSKELAWCYMFAIYCCQGRYVDVAATATIGTSNISTAVTRIGMLQYVSMILLYDAAAFRIGYIYYNPVVQEVRAGSYQRRCLEPDDYPRLSHHPIQST